MTVLVICWLLFALPMLLMAFGLFGAWLYACGAHGVKPTVAMPRFTFGNRNGQAAAQTGERLPEV
jgi:hypothetical protein